MALLLLAAEESQAVSFMLKLYEQLLPELRRQLEVSGISGRGDGGRGGVGMLWADEG
jgi:hypothetical protein